MGLSGGSTVKSTVKPVYESQILGAANGLNNAFSQNAGNVANIQSTLSGMMGTAADNYAKNPTLNAAKGYVGSTLGQGYNSTPYLQDMINQTNSSVADATTGALGTRGLTGGSAMAKILSAQLAKNETGLRYQDYNDWQDRQAQAASLAPSLSGADATNLSSLLALSDGAANISTDQALKQSVGIGGLLGQYTNGTQKQSGGGLGGLLGGVLSSVAGKLVDKINF